MMLLLENIKLALVAIKSNRMRSFLTMLGIIIGISSVIAITSIGDSAKGAVSKEFESIGAGYFYVMINWEMTEGDAIYEDDMFSWDEIDAIKERFSDDIYYTAPYFTDEGTTKVGKVSANLRIQGVNADYDKYYKKVQMQYGRMINKNDIEKNKKAIVVDVKMAQKLFGRDDIVGEKILVESGSKGPVEFLIVGVYTTQSSFFDNISMGEPTYSCFAPYPCVAYYDDAPSSYVEVYANSEKDLDEIGEKVCRWLERVKDKEEGFYTVESAASQLSQVNSILGILSLAIGAIAAISLLVGGIGIMNIMLVSVTERTREIGIRKSLGARTKDILTQFLIEAMILSVIGGIIGLLFGLGIAWIGMTIAGVGLVVNPMAVILAILFSAAVGLFFGIFPAKKAAKADPIEALRYE